MEFGEERFLGESDDNLSEITFVNPCTVNEISHDKKSTPMDQLFKEIAKNVWGCDLILCFFIAALQSYRADRCLRPFPPTYINHDGKNFNILRSTCDNIQPLNTMLNDPNKCSAEVSKLLVWLFVEKGHPVLKRVRINNVPFPSKINKIFTPHYVFEVCYQQKVEEIWQKRKSGKEIIFAYHGSAIDNFYSILKVGLQQHFSFDKEVLFGNGIYLSNDLVVSTHYSPFGQTWKNSILGSKQSVIAICEIINDVEKVRCKDSKYKGRSLNKGSLSGEIPEKYFVVTDSEMVRVKYLMVYREKTKFSLNSYISKNVLLYIVLLYLLFIFIVGLSSNNSYLKSLKKLINSLYSQ